MEHYAKPCTMVMMCCCLVLAVACRVKMYCWQGEPYLPLMANLACLLFFITSSIQHFHQQLETMVSLSLSLSLPLLFSHSSTSSSSPPSLKVLLSSLVFLLSQPDGLLRPKRSFIFVAPCLVCAILFLYIVSLSHLLPFVTRAMKYHVTLYLAGKGSLMAKKPLYSQELPQVVWLNCCSWCSPSQATPSSSTGCGWTEALPSPSATPWCS